MARELALRLQPLLYGGKKPIAVISADLERAFALAQDEIWEAVELGIDRMIAADERDRVGPISPSDPRSA